MTSLNRRHLLAAAAAMGLAGRVTAATPANVRVGAARWDSWYGAAVNSGAWHAQHNLDFPQYRFRAPFFAKLTGPQVLTINGQQADMDAEITYAAASGLKYWAFLYYDPAGADGAFANAPTLFQASALKNNLNWCWIYNYTSLKAAQTSNGFASLIAQLSQSNYETATGTRPLLYLMPSGDKIAANITATITAFRNACATAGIGNPYIALMTTDATSMAIAGADSVADYARSANTTTALYSDLVANVQSYWDTRKAQGNPLIPLCMSGWDRRPRVEHPVPWEVQYSAQRSYVGMRNYFATATPAEIANHIQSCMTWIGANPSAVPSNHALVYAWNEHDEGGWLCPTWTPGGPDTSRLDALKAVLL